MVAAEWGTWDRCLSVPRMMGFRASAGIVVTLVLGIIGAAVLSSFQRNCSLIGLDPVPYDFGPRPAPEGFWTIEFNMEEMETIFLGQNPEDLDFDSQGRLYTGLKDGWIKRIGLDGKVENLTYTGPGGHVLGLSLGPGEEIHYVDAHKGLFKISKDGVIHLLSNEVDGKKLRFTNGLVVAKDGTAYFSESSRKYSIEDAMYDVMEGQKNARILQYNPTTGTTSVFLDGLIFANGIGLSEDEDFMIFSEMFRSRVMRYWLKGEKKGTLETFLDELPVYPDNIQRSRTDGNFYIGVAGRRKKVWNWLQRTPSLTLRCLAAGPPFVNRVYESMFMHRAMVIVVSPEGKLVGKYEDPTGKMIDVVSGGSRLGDTMYFNTIAGKHVGRLNLKS